jgi:transglutaminase-like putative cysteine protease
VRVPAGIAGLLLFGVAGAAGAAPWALGPAPDWVAPIDVPAAVAEPSRDASSGTYDLVFDHQIRVSDAGTDEYYRRVIQVLTSSGVQNASEISLDFDPSAERLVLNHVRVLRGGRDVAGFRPGDVSVIRPERESDEGIYSGTLSALVFLRDVRPGDVLDYAYTLVGTAPSPAPAFMASLQMAYSVPIGRLRHRLLIPAARKLHQKTSGSVDAPSVAESRGLASYTWTRDAVPAILDEGDLPDWFDPYPAVELAEFDSWGAVARWTAELYDGVDPGTPALDAIAAQWPASLGLEERALRAVRFVQDDVRYLGLEIGPGAWEPRPPATVLSRRYGDCKDKSLLLAALLRRLGQDARPALVSTRAGRSLDARLPSPLAFDHVIVRLRLGPVTRWIDPTLAHQGGRLREIVPPRFERALVVDASTTGLETIPLPVSTEPTGPGGVPGRGCRRHPRHAGRHVIRRAGQLVPQPLCRCLARDPGRKRPGRRRPARCEPGRDTRRVPHPRFLGHRIPSPRSLVPQRRAAAAGHGPALHAPRRRPSDTAPSSHLGETRHGAG